MSTNKDLQALSHPTGAEPLIRVTDLHTHFSKKKGLFSKEVREVRAVDGISLDIFPGETLGLVGESGCGKSTFGRTLLNLVPATSGSVSYRGKELIGLSHKDMRPLRRKMQLVFQNPYSSLNPRMTIRESMEAPLRAFGERSNGRVEKIMEDVGLSLEYLDRFPHEFSGGQRQRIAIARSLILNPEFVVCDEPVSALDVSVRAQVLNLLKELQQKHGFTYLFISHDLSVVKHICDRVAVMYLGRIVELASSEELFANPRHPYTQALMNAIPLPEPGRGSIEHLKGDIPSVYDRPPGCHFTTRCPQVCDACSAAEPQLVEVAPGHWCRCPFA